MVVIKVYSQDVYAAAEVSAKHTVALEKLLKLPVNSVFFIGGDASLIAKGVEQANWFTYLEVELPETLNIYRTELAEYLDRAFSDYGVHLRVKFINYDISSVVTMINPEYKVFNDIIIEVDNEYEEHYHFDENDEDEFED
ncbi:MAG TPA: hypothetical protein VFD05_01880 [Bacilli bacterium]|nr:hypothetical protein [Bacilli bacterium]